MRSYNLLPALFAAVSIPLILKRIPPNRWYGFRTPRTLSDETIWYEANRIAGWDLLVAALFIVLVTTAMGRLHPAVVPGAIAAAVAHSFRSLQRL